MFSEIIDVDVVSSSSIVAVFVVIVVVTFVVIKQCLIIGDDDDGARLIGVIMGILLRNLITPHRHFGVLMLLVHITKRDHILRMKEQYV